MFSNLQSLINDGKDSLVSLAVKNIVKIKLNSKNLDIHIHTLEINSKEKSITATLTIPELNEPFTIQALNYKITKKNEHHFVEVEKLVKSQDWGNNYIDGKRYKIPPEVVNVTKAIL